MADLSVYYQMIESVISSLGVDPATCRGQKPGEWNLQKGSATIWVDIMWLEKEQRAYYQVMSPVCQLPKGDLTHFYQELLEINHGLYGVAFVKYETWVYIKMIREVEGLDAAEAGAMLNRVGNYADHYDDILKQKYGIS